MTAPHSGSRRRFLLTGAALGGGLLIGYGVFKPRDLLGSRDVLAVRGSEVALNAWLKIAADGVVTVAVPRSEMGQGVYTALPMLVAEELEVEWSAIRVEQAPIERIYGNVTVMVDGAPFGPDDDGWTARTARWGFARLGRVLGLQITGGSTSVRDAWLPMRIAGASARDMLLRAAAARFGVPPAACVVEAGTIIEPATKRRLGYGEIASDAAKLDPPDDPRLKSPAEFKLIGRNALRLDVPSKVEGSAEFAIDVRPRGLVFAAIKACPVFGGRVKGVDARAVRGRDGVIAVVTLDDAVAVVADHYWRAHTALSELPIEFDPGEHAALDSATIDAWYDEAMQSGDADTYEDEGDALGQLDGAGTGIEASYRVPFLAHACMEPMNCTALVTDDRCEIWSGNQAPTALRRIAAGLTGLSEAQVVLHTTFLGGGFGRRGEADVMRQAIAVAQTVKGRPVQLIWSREEDLQHDAYRPPALARFRASLDATGRLQAWWNRIVGPSATRAVFKRTFPELPFVGPDRTSVDGAAFLPYEVAHRRVEHVPLALPVPVGFWRSVGHSYNAFFTECFMDELARAAGQDPIDFRVAHLARHPRHVRVLRLLAERSAWDTPPPDGRARGVALHESFGSIVGQTAEVRIDHGELRVDKVVCVIDCGRVVNPDIVIAQMESGIVFGLTAALHGEITLADGRVQQRNFPDYPMLALARCPAIETHVIDSGRAPGGVGEPGTPPIAPAVANAARALTGRAVRRLPIRL